MQSLYQHSTICKKYNYEQFSEPITINNGVRWGCGLSLNLFNIYIDKSHKGRETVHTQWNSTCFLAKNETVLFVDDQVLVAKSEDELQKVAYELNKTAEKHVT